MKKQKKQFFIILVILVFCIAALAVLKLYDKNENAKQAKKEADAVIQVIDLDAEDVTAFSYINNNETLEFVKEDDSWYYAKDKTQKLNQETITSMLDTVTALEASQQITDYEDLSEYGLDTPSNTVTLTTKNGTVTLEIGAKNDILSTYYAMLPGEEKLYLIESSVSSAFLNGVDALLEEERTETESMTGTEAAAE